MSSTLLDITVLREHLLSEGWDAESFATDRVTIFNPGYFRTVILTIAQDGTRFPGEHSSNLLTELERAFAAVDKYFESNGIPINHRSE